MTRPNDPFRDYLFPEARAEGCDEWCAALHHADTMFRHHPDHRYFHVDDFMIMAAVRRRGKPLLYLYKHVETRRYLNIDADGVTWRFVAPARGADGDGRYVRHRRPGEAFDHLQLWLVPQMRGSRFLTSLFGDDDGEWDDDGECDDDGEWDDDGWDEAEWEDGHI